MADVEVTLTVNNTELVKQATEDAIEIALEAVGLQAEGYAKKLCPTDTGLLKNSITHAVSGKPAAMSSYHATYGGNRYTSGKNAGKRITASSENAGAVGYGSYSGNAPSEGNGRKSVYIGTNVEYAAYVERGTSRQDPQPFLEPAVMGHTSTYRRIFEEQLERTLQD